MCGVIEHEGVKYRKAQREAVDGELIIMSKDDEQGDFSLGDIYTVVGAEFFDREGDRRDIIDHEYSVLSPVKETHV